jgi:hypothetical protein
VSPASVARFERGGPKGEWIEGPIRAALESAGVEFIAENGGGAGVRLRKGKLREDDAPWPTTFTGTNPCAATLRL